jgi:hypothetical protein
VDQNGLLENIWERQQKKVSWARCFGHFEKRELLKAHAFTRAHNLRRPNAIPIGVGERIYLSQSAACHLSILPIPSHIPLTWHSGTEVVSSGYLGAWGQKSYGHWTDL